MTTTSNHVKLTQQELVDRAKERFGDDPKKWAFQCPSCGDVATAQDFKDADADPNRIGQDCIGRALGALSRDQQPYKGRGCDWAAYGLFRGPWEIVMPDGHSAYGFALAEVSK